MAELLRIHEQNPEMKKIRKAVEILRRGGVIIFPTDTVYGIGCDLHNKKGIDSLARIIQLKARRFQLSFICHDLSMVSQYTRPLSSPVFKILKRCLPGPFTFLLESSNDVPKILNVSKKTVGVRIPANNIVNLLVEELGNPMMSASIKDEDQVVEYTTDPEIIFDRFKSAVDVVINGGHSGVIPSTIVDLTSGEPELQREGLGDPDLIY